MTGLSKHVTHVQIAKYAAATGDFNPLHLDDEHARRAGLPGVIAHGLLTLGFAGQAVTEAVGGDPSRVRSMSMRFAKPVRPGDDVVIDLVVANATSEERELEIVVRRGDDVVATGRARVES